MNRVHSIEAARLLAGSGASPSASAGPRQAMLRRAVSTAYYAMFHALCQSNADHSTKLQRSALWAAYGDALRWISELTDERGLKGRTSGKLLERPLKWTRRIGGPMGVTASLPTGCYSDDSQLRLATSRATHSDGFNVDAFAKVELPTWLSYARWRKIKENLARRNFA